MLSLEFCELLFGVNLMLNHVGISQEELDAAWREATDLARVDSGETEDETSSD